MAPTGTASSPSSCTGWVAAVLGDRLDAEADRLEEEVEGKGEAPEERAEADIEAREHALDARQDDEAATVFSDVVSGDAFGDGLSLPELHISLGLFILLLAAVRLL